MGTKVRSTACGAWVGWGHHWGAACSLPAVVCFTPLLVLLCFVLTGFCVSCVRACVRACVAGTSASNKGTTFSHQAEFATERTGTGTEGGDVAAAADDDAAVEGDAAHPEHKDEATIEREREEELDSLERRIANAKARSSHSVVAAKEMTARMRQVRDFVLPAVVDVGVCTRVCVGLLFLSLTGWMMTCAWRSTWLFYLAFCVLCCVVLCCVVLCCVVLCCVVLCCVVWCGGLGCWVGLGWVVVLALRAAYGGHRCCSGQNGGPGAGVLGEEKDSRDAAGSVFPHRVAAKDLFWERREAGVVGG